MHVAVRRDGSAERVGRITLADQVKPDSVAAVKSLHDLGLWTVLLTGDNRATAEAVAGQVGIRDVRADVSPSGKADALRELREWTKKTDAEASAQSNKKRESQAELAGAAASA